MARVAERETQTGEEKFEDLEEVEDEGRTSKKRQSVVWVFFCLH